jgi:hypothetical protein
MTISYAAATIAVATNKPLVLSKILDISRGGAFHAAKSLSSSTSKSQKLKSDNEKNKNELMHKNHHDFTTSIPIPTCISSRGGGKEDPQENQSGFTPQGKSVLFMAIAMSLHYLSYSIARPSTIALFTSAKTGFAGNTAAFPLAMAFISPTALGLLLLYGKILGRAGPRGAIRQTTFLVASVLGIASTLVHIFSQGVGSNIRIPLFGIANISIIQALVGALFIFRESYVQLLTSQYWSFMASILNPDQSAKWFSPISGLTSITSAFAGLGVERVVDKVGLPGALGKIYHHFIRLRWYTALNVLPTDLLFSELFYF